MHLSNFYSITKGASGKLLMAYENEQKKIFATEYENMNWEK